MRSNREISKLFSLYAELLLLHSKDERLAALLSGAAYRLRNIEQHVIETNKKQPGALFRPEADTANAMVTCTTTIIQNQTHSLVML